MNSTEYEQAAARASRLTFLLDKSQIYAKIIGDRMARQQIEKRKAEQRAETRKANKEKKDEGTAGREGMRDKKKVAAKEEQKESGTAKRRRKSDVNGSNKKAKVEEAEVSLLTTAPAVETFRLIYLRTPLMATPNLKPMATTRSLIPTSRRRGRRVKRKTRESIPSHSPLWSQGRHCETTN